MPLQDRSGSRYEQLLAASLIHLGYELNGTSKKNYLHPSKRSRLLIPGTYIQPDLVVRHNTDIHAIIYATHWSKQRNSAFKYWRTWEEAAQQKLALGKQLLTVNCVFEALPSDAQPNLYVNSDELPRDPARHNNLPITFNGWYPALSWAMVEAFDITLLFPFGYTPVHKVTEFSAGEHDPVTSTLVKRALAKPTKTYLFGQWDTLQQIRKRALDSLPPLQATHSRYRIGLLHVYICYRLASEILKSHTPELTDFIAALVDTDQEAIKIDHLARNKAFSRVKLASLLQVFERISQVYVRTGANPETLCTLSTFSNPSTSTTIHRISFNQDLRSCLQDLRNHLNVKGFIETVERAFKRFDSAYRIDEMLEDLSHPSLIKGKHDFVRTHFATALHNTRKLKLMLDTHAKAMSPERSAVSDHGQNWVLEMLVYLAGLNVAEDIYPRITEIFERSGHRLRPHAPFGDHTALITYLLQGRDVCESWSPRSDRRTLSKDEFRDLCYQSFAECVRECFQQRGSDVRDEAVVVNRYAQNKSMRIIGSGLNGFYIMVDHFLGDLCIFNFSDEEDEELGERNCSAWQTDVISSLWGGRPLQTRVEGISRNGDWLIKAQSSQDGNEGHKTKELSGRCRSTHLAWSHGSDIRKRSEWSFTKRPMMKLALVLDGDWDTSNKQNLYEAGWDWVGDVSELSELRKLIMDT